MTTKPITPTTRPAPFVVGGDGAGATYRLGRNHKNVVLQRRQPGGHWRTIGYAGNSPRGIVRLVSELAAEHWSPADGKTLGRQLASLERAILSLKKTIAVTFVTDNQEAEK